MARSVILSALVCITVTGCGRRAPVQQTARRQALETALPASVKALLQPKITWGGCWSRWRFGRGPVLVTAHNAGEPTVPVEFPTTVAIDDGSDGATDLVLRYQYDARGNVTSFETDEGADGLDEERVTLERDDNGAITKATRNAKFPFARRDVQSFTFNPYGYLVATDDFYKQRSFAANEVAPVSISPDGTRISVGALAFTRNAAGDVTEVRNERLGLVQTFSGTTRHMTAKTSTGSREIDLDPDGRLVTEVLQWSGGGRRTSYRYDSAGPGAEIEIEQSELPADRCTARWRVTRDARGELVAVSKDDACNGSLDLTIDAKLDAAGRLMFAKYNDRTVTVSYKDDLVESARFTYGPTYDETIKYEYDATGRLLAQRRSTETLRWTYDRYGRVVTATMTSQGASVPSARTITYTYASAPLDLAAAPACVGDRNISSLVMASELDMPALDANVPALFDDNVALNLPSVRPLVPPARFEPLPLRELRTAIRAALAREGWTAVRYELVENRDGENGEGKRAGPVAKRGVHECAGTLPYYARDNGAYFELEIEKRCKTTSTSPEYDPLSCQWGTRPPEFDLVLHVPSRTSSAKPRKLVVDLPNCVTYTGAPPRVP